MKKIIFVLILFVYNYSYSQEIDLTNDGKQYWTNNEWRKSNTARLHFYMPKRVRESIRFSESSSSISIKIFFYLCRKSRLNKLK